MDSAGVEIVGNADPGWDQISRWRLERDLQVGDVEGPAAFGDVRWVAPGPGDGLLVLDAQSRRVHAFAADGAHRLSFGREGDGPGEFRRPASVTFIPADRIAVAEGFPPVVHWLDTTGAYLAALHPSAAHAAGETRLSGFLAAWQVTTSGVSFAQAILLGPPVDGMGNATPVRLLRFGPRSAVPDTVLEWTWEPGFGTEQIRAFEPQKTWAPGRDGSFLFAPGGPYEVRVYDPGGSLTRIVRREIAPVPVTRQHREAAHAELRREMSAGGAPPSMVDELLSRVTFERTLPHVRRVWLSEPDRHIWVGVHDADLAPSDPSSAAAMNAWDVFGPQGTFLGRLPIPQGFSLHVVTESGLYGSWISELEVPYAVRYRIVQPG